jgi:hypothetical protein
MATVHLKEDLRALVPRMDSSFTPEDVDTLDYRILPIRLLELFTPTIAAEGLTGFDLRVEANRQTEGPPLTLLRGNSPILVSSREAFQV